jgi:hypothetical protein
MMMVFSHLDYIGDKCISMLAAEYRPQHIADWEKKYGNNIFLTKVYKAVMGSTKPFQPKNYAKFRKKGSHLTASHVEAWLGIILKDKGFSEMKACWERLMKLVGCVKYKPKSMRNK